MDIMRGFLPYLRRFLLLMVFVLPLQAADDAFTQNDLDKLNAQVDTAETSLDPQRATIPVLDQLTTTAAGLEQTAQTCITQQEQKQAQNRQAIESLGEPVPDEAPDVKDKRRELETQKQQIEKMLSQCRLVSLRAITLLDKARETRQILLKKELFAKTDDVLDNLYGVLLEPGRWKAETQALINTLVAPLVRAYSESLTN